MRGLGFVGFGECTVMNTEDKLQISAAIEWPLIEICASGATTVNRRQLFWTSEPVVSSRAIDAVSRARGSRGLLRGEREPCELWVLPGWEWRGGPMARLPTFTRAIRCPRPPPGAPGLHEIVAHELARYKCCL